MMAADLQTRFMSELPQFWQGTLTTFWISFTAVIFGFFLGVLLHALLNSRNYLLALPARVYVSIIRGTPVLAQLLVLYYVPSSFGWNIPGTFTAVLGLALNTAAYQSQILGTGFAAIPRGQIEAARTFNLSRRQTLWHIEIPQVLSLTLPALASEMIDVVKASAVISVISVTDLMRIGQQISSASYRPLETYLLVALFYLLLTSLLSAGVRSWEKRLNRHHAAPTGAHT